MKALYSRHSTHYSNYSTLRNAQESRLLCLPAELRNIIYEYVLGGQQIVLEFQLRHVSGFRRNPYLRCWPAKSKYICEGPNTLFQAMRPTAPLMLSCRKIYTEAELLPFSLNQITFRGLNEFFVFMKRLTDRQRNAIRTIRSGSNHLGSVFAMLRTSKWESSD
jgi:hypothetical protein